jgi:hypothetical protein
MMMSNLRFDWRWVVLIVAVAVLANGRRLPWPLLAVGLAAGGGYLLYQGWLSWGGTRNSGPQVKYWRGQRYEVRTRRRGPSLPPLSAIGPAVLYLVIGGALVLAALAIVLRQIS